MVEHRQEFQRELEAIEAKVIELFAMVGEDLAKATDALLTGNNEVVKLLAERERVINALYPEIEELVDRAILLQAPVASDLRFLLSVLRIVPELERSHDLVEHIARRADHILKDDLSPRARGLVERMGVSYPTCGARQRTPGTAGTVPSRPSSPNVMRRWTSCTRA